MASAALRISAQAAELGAALGRSLGEDAISAVPVGDGSYSTLQEIYRVEQWNEGFIGLTGGHLCYTFGFERNHYTLLALQMVCAFAFFKLLMCVGRLKRCSGPGMEDPPERDFAIDELDNFGSLVDEQLGQRTGVGAQASERGLQSVLSTLASQAPLQTTTQVAHASQTASSSLHLGPPERPKELQALHGEVQEKVAALKVKWEEERSRKLDDWVNHLAHHEAGMAVAYLRYQAVVSFMVLVGICVSIAGIPHPRGIWNAYCIFAFAYANSGLLPSAVLGVAYMMASSRNPVFLVPGADSSGRPDPSYHLLPTATASGPAVAAHDLAKRMEQAINQAMVAVLPMAVPLLLVVATHVLPFALAYIWVVLVVVIPAVVFVRLFICLDRFLSIIAELPGAWLLFPRQQSTRQAEVAILILSTTAGLIAMMGVFTMTRVYSGEYPGGGYVNNLVGHFVKDPDWSRSPCSWGGVREFVDLLLRWT